MSEPTAAEKRRRLRRYLERRVADGECYVKSRYVAEEVDLSPKEVGCLLGELHAPIEGVRIEKWGYSGATTWRVASEPDN